MKFNLTNKLFLLLLIFGIGCNSGKNKKAISFEKKKVTEASVLLSAESSDSIASPAWIKSVPEGFLIYDPGFHKIYRFDLDGNKRLSFGKHGRGPGEFQSVAGFWSFNDSYLVYDRRSQKLIAYDDAGKPAKDVPLKFVEFPKIPVSIEAISSRRFVMPSSGKNGALLKMINTATDSIHLFGKTVDKDKQQLIQQVPDKLRQPLSLDRDKNKILLSRNQTGIFVFQQTTAILEKYAHSGKLIWQKSIKVPAIQGLFSKVLKEDKDRLKNGEFLFSFVYGAGISANKDGVAVLLNVQKPQPITVVWVPNGGETTTVVTFPTLKNPQPMPVRFALSDGGSYILFSYTLDGKVYKAHWPYKQVK